MSPRSRNVQSVEKLLDQVADTADRITRASARQAREIDRQLKRLIDRGESSTERALTRLDDELRIQLAGLRKDLRALERHVAKLRTASSTTTASKAKATKKVTKKVTKRATTKRKARPPVKKAGGAAKAAAR